MWGTRQALRDHIDECRRRAEEFNAKLDAHGNLQMDQHRQNLEHMAKIERAIWLAVGGGVTIGFILSHPGILKAISGG